MRRIGLFVLLALLALATWSVHSRRADVLRPRAPHSRAERSAQETTDGDVAAARAEEPDGRAPDSIWETAHWVVDRDGEPIAGARVAAIVETPHEIGFSREERAHAITEGDGRTTVALGPWDSLSITAPGKQGLFRRSPSRASRRNTSTHTLVPALALAVRVVDAAGTPLPKAHVHARPVPRPNRLGCSQDSIHGVVRTDADGRVALDVAPDEELLVFAWSGTRATRQRRLAAGQGEVTMVAVETQTLRGHVEPRRAGITVAFAPFPFGDSDTTDAEGRFELSAVPSGPIELWASGDGYAAGVELPPRPEDRDKEIVVRITPSRSYLAFRVTGPDTAGLDDIRWTCRPITNRWWSQSTRLHGDLLVRSWELPPGTPVVIEMPNHVTLRTTASPEMQTIALRPAVRFQVVGDSKAKFDRAFPDGGGWWHHREVPGTPLRWTVDTSDRRAAGTLPAARWSRCRSAKRLRCASGSWIRPGARSQDGWSPSIRWTGERSTRTARSSSTACAPVRSRSRCARSFRSRRATTASRSPGSISRSNPARPATSGNGSCPRSSRSAAVSKPRVDAPVTGREFLHARHPDGHVALADAKAPALILSAGAQLVVSDSFAYKRDVRIRSSDGVVLARETRGFQVALPPGRYVVTNGRDSRRVHLRAGATTRID